MPTSKDRHGWLRGSLADKGLRQKDISEMWGCDEAVVSRFIKTGEPALTFDRALSLSKKLNMTLDELTVRLQEGIAPRKAVLKPIAPAVARAAGAPAEGGLAEAMAEAHAAVQRLRELLPEGVKVVFQINYGE